jgi:hypothetical protein
MKTISKRDLARSALGALLPLILAGPLLAADPGDELDRLLERYVTDSGVRYGAWRDVAADRQALASVIATLSATDPATLAPADRYALYINLYNAKILELIVEGDPPKSIRDLSNARFGFGIFYRKVLEFDGKSISLNALEKRLRVESGDPRIHFALNCASRSCPALAREAYRGDRLDEQLERQTRLSLSNPLILQLELEDERSGKPRLVLQASKIFDWFGGDFDVAGGVVPFIVGHAPDEIASRIESSTRTKLEFQKYDWTLNAALSD